MVNLKLFIWALIAGSFIPLVGILNGRAGRVLGDPLFACVLVFFVGLFGTSSNCLYWKRVSRFPQLWATQRD